MSTDTGKVVVNRAMSLDGFIAGPGHTMDWIFEFLTPDAFPEVMAATGAMLIGRGTYEVAKQMPDEEERNYEGGAQFVLTHDPPDKPDPNVTFLTCDIAEAVATALSAAGGKNLEILGADLASQCLQRGLVDEIHAHGLGRRICFRPARHAPFLPQRGANAREDDRRVHARRNGGLVP